MRYGSVAIFFTILASEAALSAEVRLRSSAACTTMIVRLADVAEVFADDARMAESLAEIPLCPAPAAGSQRALSQDDVRQLLALSGVERKTAQVTGSETVTVTTESTSRFTAGARRPLVAAGIRQAAFEIDAEISRKPQTRSAVKPQNAPTPDMQLPAAPRVVERGAIVTVCARTAGVRITTSGKALEAGSTGDTVGIELADTKQRVLARVTGPQAVEVTDGSTSESAPPRQSPAAAAANQ
jgi:flagella basal body P-ring formation protein FlgA